jgi:beta-lactamase regulating signal transducer with metallopeptidase domain
MIGPGFAVAEAIARQSAVALLAGIVYALPVAIAAWIAIRLLPRANAATRYGIWSAALIAIALLDPLPGHRFSLFASGTTTTPVNPNVASAIFSLPADWALALFVAWYAIATALVIRLIVGHLALQRIKDRATPLPARYQLRLAAWLSGSESRRMPRLLVSRDIETPLAIGLLHPAIVIPEHLVGKLSDDEIDQICLHELAHLQRGDDWTNLAQKAAEALLFFSPAVHLIARQMSVEREIACDDWVVAVTGRARPYATCLTRLAEIASLSRPLELPSLGAYVTRKQIFIRVERLLHRAQFVPPGIAVGASWAACAALLVLLAFEAQLAPIVAVGPQPTITSAISTGAPQAASQTALAPMLVRHHELANAHRVIAYVCQVSRSRAHRIARLLAHRVVGTVSGRPKSVATTLASAIARMQAIGAGGVPAGGAGASTGGAVGRNAHAARARGLDGASAHVNY